MTTRTSFTGISPIFPVADLEAALAHYAQLGFDVHVAGELVEDADYGFASRDGLSLHLTARADYYPNARVSVAYVHVADADALAAEWDRPGIGGETNPPIDTPWRMREGTHFDPDGNLLRFGSPVVSVAPGG
jgi:predicted enzyme related to lactoylglutathione lyase